MRKIHSILITALSVAVIGMTAALALAGPEANLNAVGKEPKVTEDAKPSEPAVPAALPKPYERSVIRALIEQETLKTNLPADIAEAVVFVESSYDASTIGRVGEIGLMQIRPGTAAMLGFKGSVAELATPELNIHFGVAYLSQAWSLAQGDLCRALMKYRAGHGEEVMSPLSVTYCKRARSRLVAMGSPYAGPGPWPTVALTPIARVEADLRSTPELVRPTDVYATYRRGTPEASHAFWAAHEARVHAIVARIEAKWRHVASR
jgi:soluble lytic murein transglycosylase-like protein